MTSSDKTGTISLGFCLGTCRPVNREGHIRAKYKPSNHKDKSASLSHVTLWLTKGVLFVFGGCWGVGGSEVK